MAVSREDFDRFMAGVRAQPYHCFICANSFYAINLGAPSEPGEIRLRPEGATGTHQFYSVSCTNCGRTDFFHAKQIQAWLSAHPKA